MKTFLTVLMLLVLMLLVMGCGWVLLARNAHAPGLMCLAAGFGLAWTVTGIFVKN